MRADLDGFNYNDRIVKRGQTSGENKKTRKFYANCHKKLATRCRLITWVAFVVSYKLAYYNVKNSCKKGWYRVFTMRQ